MTSNLGSDLIREKLETMTDANRESVINSTKEEILEMLKKTIRPEFLNRIDETIMFLPLTKPQVGQIVRLQLNHVAKRLADQGFTLKWTDSAVNYLTEVGYDPEFGARPVKRAVQDYVLNDLSKQLLAGKVNRSQPIIIDYFGNGLIFRNK